MSIHNISVVIIAQNAQNTLKESLDSLTDFDEIILYLNNSSDKSEDIAKEFSNVKIYKGEFIGFGPTKNLAASYATNSWILSLDSDEILNHNIIEELIRQDFSNEKNIFILCRDNYFLGYKNGSSDYIVRVYNKNFSSFNDNLVHEKIIVTKEHNKITLKNHFKHLHITDINQTLTKMIKYTDLGSKDKKICFFTIVILKSSFAFFKSYFLRLYILRGWIGFTLSVTNANRRFYKYLKQYINCKKLDK